MCFLLDPGSTAGGGEGLRRRRVCWGTGDLLFVIHSKLQQLFVFLYFFVCLFFLSTPQGRVPAHFSSFPDAPCVSCCFEQCELCGFGSRAASCASISAWLGHLVWCLSKMEHSYCLEAASAAGSGDQTHAGYSLCAEESATATGGLSLGTSTEFISQVLFSRQPQ